MDDHHVPVAVCRGLHCRNDSKCVCLKTRARMKIKGFITSFLISLHHHFLIQMLLEYPRFPPLESKTHRPYVSDRLLADHGTEIVKIDTMGYPIHWHPLTILDMLDQCHPASVIPMTYFEVVDGFFKAKPGHWLLPILLIALFGRPWPPMASERGVVSSLIWVTQMTPDPTHILGWSRLQISHDISRTLTTILVGGLEHEFYDFPYVGNNNPNWPNYIVYHQPA